MRQSFSHLDGLLRGDATRPDAIRDGTVQIQVGNLAMLIVLLGAIYGLCMGSYSLLKEVPPQLVGASPRYMQLVATTVKVPALFYLTLLVTFPSLYVFNALVGSRLTVSSVLKLLVASLAVNLAVLSSLGPIVLFFSLTTKSYAFIKLLNVVVFTLAGILGLVFLRQTLHRLTETRKRAFRIPNHRGESSEEAVNTELQGTSHEVDKAGSSSDLDDSSALDIPPGQVIGQHTRMVFGCWMIVFGLVGAQMGWVLRPFIGAPNLPFSWFRERGSNFFEAVLRSIGALFG